MKNGSSISVLLGSNRFTGQIYTIDQPAKLGFARPPTSTAAGSIIDGSNGVQVAVEDSGGATVSVDSSVVTLTLSSGTFASGGNTVSVAAVSGVATFNNLIINPLGNYTLTASDGTLSQATSQSFAVFGPALKLGFTQPPINSGAGTLTPAVVVAVQDALGNTVTTNSSTVTLTLGGGTFAGGGNTATVTAVNGIATFSNLIISTLGNYTLAATDGTLSGVTSNSFTITAGAAAYLVFAQQPTNTAPGVAINPAVAVAIKDAYGHTVLTDSSTVALSLTGGTFSTGQGYALAAAVNGIATFSNLIINADRNYSLTATDGSLTYVNSQVFTVIGPAVKLSFTQQPVGPGVGMAISPAVTVAVQDSLSSTVAANNSVVTLTLNGGTFASGGNTASIAAVNGVATFNNLVINTTGNYTLTASDGALTGATSSVFTVAPYCAVLSVNRENPSGTGADFGSVTYAVTFGEPVTGVIPADFQLALTGATTANSTVAVSPAGGYNSVYHVTVSNVTGYGILGLNLVDNGSILDQAGNHLANASATFQAAQTFATGSGPGCVAVADLNGDGKQDLVTANGGDSTLSVLLGNGDGTFQPQQTFATGTWPVCVVAADVNGDGKPDLIVDNNGSTVSVLLGNGDGTFQTQKTFAVGSYPQGVAVADLNGDGKLDLAVANEDNVGVLLGNGDGTFQAQKTFSTGLCSHPYSIAVADVNCDGNPDLVVCDPVFYTANVLLGNGDGTFQTQRTFAAGSDPVSIAVADINGDGRPDLITSNYLGYNLSMFLGNGDGTFQVQRNLSVGSHPLFVTAADINGDGKPDLVACNQNSNNVSVLLANNNFTGQVYTISQSALAVLVDNGLDLGGVHVQLGDAGIFQVGAGESADHP